VIVVSEDGNQIIGSVAGDAATKKASYKNLIKSVSAKTFQPGALKFAKRYVSYLEEQKIEAAVAGVKKDFIYPDNEDWISSNGKKVNAKFVSLTGNTLNLVVKKIGYSEKKYNFNLDKLDEASQQKANKWATVLAEQDAKLEKAIANAKQGNKKPSKSGAKKGGKKK